MTLDQRHECDQIFYAAIINKRKLGKVKRKLGKVNIISASEGTAAPLDLYDWILEFN